MMRARLPFSPARRAGLVRAGLAKRPVPDFDVVYLAIDINGEGNAGLVVDDDTQKVDTLVNLGAGGDAVGVGAGFATMTRNLITIGSSVGLELVGVDPSSAFEIPDGIALPDYYIRVDGHFGGGDRYHMTGDALGLHGGVFHVFDGGTFMWEPGNVGGLMASGPLRPSYASVSMYFTGAERGLIVNGASSPAAGTTRPKIPNFLGYEGAHNCSFVLRRFGRCEYARRAELDEFFDELELAD